VLLGGIGGLELGEEEIAVFGDEEEDQAVDEAEELAVVVARGEGAAAQGVVQGSVVGVAEQAGAEVLDGGLDAAAEALEHTHARGLGALVPGLDGGGGGVARGGFGGAEAGGVADEPEEAEVGEALAVEDRLEVEL
jgi:hypothetical protein